MPTYSKNGKLGWAPLIFTGAIIGTLILFGVASRVYMKATDPFDGKCEQYLEITAKQDSANPYLRGQIVVVAIGSRDGPHVNSQMQNALPSDLRARRPADVATAVLSELYFATEGYYAPPIGAKARQYQGPASRECYKVSIIDVPMRKIIKERSFCDGPPPPTCPGSSCVGSDPSPEVVAYLIALPRK